MPPTGLGPRPRDYSPELAACSEFRQVMRGRPAVEAAVLHTTCTGWHRSALNACVTVHTAVRQLTPGQQPPQPPPPGQGRFLAYGSGKLNLFPFLVIN